MRCFAAFHAASPRGGPWGSSLMRPPDCVGALRKQRSPSVLRRPLGWRHGDERFLSRTGRGSAAATVVGALAVAALLAVVLAGRRHEFAEALRAAPVWALVLAAALQIVALVSRCEAWRTCVGAAGATISRRRLFRAGGLGNLGRLLNAHLGAAARSGA